MLSIDHGYRKPHPSIYRAALDQLECPPHAAAFVGDSYDADFVGPRAIGMTAYLIDAADKHAVANPWRLSSVLDIEGRVMA